MIIDLLSSRELGFRKGVGETAGKQLVNALTDVLFEILPEERLQRLKDRGVHLPEFFSPLIGRGFNNPEHHKHARLAPLSKCAVQEMVGNLLQV